MEFFTDPSFDPKSRKGKKIVDNGVPDTTCHVEKKIDGKQKRQIGKQHGGDQLGPKAFAGNSHDNVKDRKEDQKPCQKIHAVTKMVDQPQNQQAWQNDF